VSPVGRDLSGTLSRIRSKVRRAEKGEEQDSGGASAESRACVEGQV